MAPIKLLIVGGSFGGLSVLQAFVKRFLEEEPKGVDVEIFLIDPRAGFLNVIAIPKAIVDVEFAKKTYVDLEHYGIKFDSVESTDLNLIDRVREAKWNAELYPGNLKIRFIHGKCIKFLNDKTMIYKLNGNNFIRNLRFDYAVVATGRRRNWPFTPQGETKDQFISEVQYFEPQIAKAQKITVIGGGAICIEIAGSLKQLYKRKDITLVHAHTTLPPDSKCTELFKDALRKGIELNGIKLKLNTRIQKELSGGRLLTTNGEIIESDLALWTNTHQNNIEPLLPFFAKSIDPKKKEVIVEKSFLVQGSKTIFAIGDIIHLKMSKLAGSAFFAGVKVANSLYNIIVEQKEEYDEVDPDKWPIKMAVVVGTDFAVLQQADASVHVNAKQTLVMYEDYRNTEFTTDIFKFDLPQQKQGHR